MLTTLAVTLLLAVPTLPASLETCSQENVIKALRIAARTETGDAKYDHRLIHESKVHVDEFGMTRAYAAPEACLLPDSSCEDGVVCLEAQEAYGRCLERRLKMQQAKVKILREDQERLSMRLLFTWDVLMACEKEWAVSSLIPVPTIQPDPKPSGKRARKLASRTDPPVNPVAQARAVARPRPSTNAFSSSSAGLWVNIAEREDPTQKVIPEMEMECVPMPGTKPDFHGTSCYSTGRIKFKTKPDIATQIAWVCDSLPEGTLPPDRRRWGKNKCVWP